MLNEKNARPRKRPTQLNKTNPQNPIVMNTTLLIKAIGLAIGAIWFVTTLLPDYTLLFNV